ncbi:protein kinase [Methanothermococcus sp. SCGC AD-155-E23]|nr:protein kinase [Methanothermococcus sp. SCGC AD-155-E23]
MDVILESFTCIFRERDWAKKLLKGGIIGIIPLVNISLVGYMADVMESIYQGDWGLPEFRIFSQFIKGLKIFVILSLYFIFVYMLFLLLFVIVFVIFNMDGNDVVEGIVLIVTFLISMVLTQVTLSHYVYTREITSIFHFSTIWRVLKKTWFTIAVFYTLYFILFLIFLMVTIIVGIIPLLNLLAIWLIGAFFYYSAVVFGHFSARTYLQGIEKSTSWTGEAEIPKDVGDKVKVSEETDVLSDSPKEAPGDKLEEILTKKYLELKEYVKKVLSRVKEGEVIKDKGINELIKREIDTLSKLENLDGFEMFTKDGKPILVHREGKIVVYTTLGLSLIEARKSPHFEEIKERVQKMHFEPYKRENRVFFRGFDLEGNRKFSDVQLFIWDFRDIKRLKREVERIIRGITSKGMLEASTLPDFPGELLEKYIPLEKLGEGGFGKVFKVKRRGGTLPLAVKVPKLEESAKKYLMKEIEVWRNLNHPNIVKLYDAFIEPIPHIEMEYVEGYRIDGEVIRDLERYRKPVDPKEAIRLMKEIGEGLKHAHDRDIIHRDIKPSNILLTENLTPKITDWGLAKVGMRSTTTTVTKGLTLLYSAPEQIDEVEYGKTDKRTDIYQLGVLFYELLTGRLPYEGITPAQISLKITNPNIKPIPPSKIDPKLSIFDGVFEKLLAKRKEDRYQSIDEFLEALNSIEEIVREKEKFKDTLNKTTERLKVSRDKREIERLTRELIDASVKLALNCARINDKVGLLDTLELLREYVKSEENREELERAISYIEHLIKEGIPVGRDTLERLEVLLNRIRREYY